jgi:hypothetical protein
VVFTEVEFVYKNSIYFPLLVHKFLYSSDDALVVRNILNFYIQILSQFVKPPSDTLLRYVNMFHLRHHYHLYSFLKPFFSSKFSEYPSKVITRFEM